MYVFGVFFPLFEKEAFRMEWNSATEWNLNSEILYKIFIDILSVVIVNTICITSRHSHSVIVYDALLQN